IGRDVIAVANEVRLVGQHVFQALLFAHDLLRFLGVGPEIGIGGLLLDLGQLLAQVARVKDTPEVRELCLSGLHILFRALLPWYCPLEIVAGNVDCYVSVRWRTDTSMPSAARE